MARPKPTFPDDAAHFIVDASIEVVQEAVGYFDDNNVGGAPYRVQELDGYSLSENEETGESAVTLWYDRDMGYSLRDVFWAFLIGWFAGRGATFRLE